MDRSLNAFGQRDKKAALLSDVMESSVMSMLYGVLKVLLYISVILLIYRAQGRKTNPKLSCLMSN